MTHYILQILYSDWLEEPKDGINNQYHHVSLTVAYDPNPIKCEAFLLLWLLLLLC